MTTKTTKTTKIKLDPEHGLGDYHARDPSAKRHRVLRAAIEERGHVKVIRRLNVLFIYNKYRHPKTAAVFRKDMQYVQRLHRKGV